MAEDKGTPQASKVMTVDEIINAINHSREVVILVEGVTDVSIYRRILEDLECEGHMMATGGCGILREIFKKKDELKNKRVIFVTDKDYLAYEDKLPEEYENDVLIFTKGYSIENDLAQGKKFADNFFEKNDRVFFQTALNEFLDYYVCEYEKYKRGEAFNFAKNPYVLLNCTSGGVCVLKSEGLENYSAPNEITKKKFFR